MKTGGLRYLISPPWEPFSKKCVFRHCVFRVRMDSRPKRCSTCVFSKKNVVWTGPKVFFTTDLVRSQLTRLHSCKAAGPDSVPSRALKACAPQLCGILSQVFNLSLHLQRVPVLWKLSCLIPVPKTLRPMRPWCPTSWRPWRSLSWSS